ncbi:MAG TPA: NUDIX domain-containing protein [Chitinophagaceae bacterium]|nr:NUDIX domain-containing protein [Chitinophagaceae bacterium]
MPQKSAGILPYRWRNNEPEFFLVHPGGPFWSGKEKGSWSVVKGEVEEGEDLLQAAIREFKEETGFIPREPFLPLQPVRQKSGKMVFVWATNMELDPLKLKSNTFSVEWPPRSGIVRAFPEIDKGEWMELQKAGVCILPAQKPLLDALHNILTV